MYAVFSHNHAFLCDIAFNDVIAVEVGCLNDLGAAFINGSTSAFSPKCFIATIQDFPKYGVVARYIT